MRNVSIKVITKICKILIFWKIYTLRSFTCSTIVKFVSFKIYILFTFLISRSLNSTLFLIFRGETTNQTTHQWQLNNFEAKHYHQLLIDMYTLASSAYIFTVQFFTTIERSLTCKRKSKGPRTDPWGTQFKHAIKSETLEESLTFCFLSCKKTQIYLTVCNCKPWI